MDKLSRPEHEAKALKQVFLRTFISNLSTNSVKGNGQGFCFTMIPWLRNLYKENPKELSAAMVRYNAYFNTNLAFMPFIAGIAVAMEKERANSLGTEKELNTNIIDNMKISLQGPLAGLGDSLMFNTLRVIAAGIAIPLCADGSLVGPILFVLINVLVQLFIRYKLFYTGYDIGTPFIEKVVNTGTVDSVVTASSIVGLSMLGALICTNVKLGIRYVLQMGDVTLNIQEILDSIMPNMLQLGVLCLTVFLLKKKISPTRIIFIYLITAIILGTFGIL